MNTTNTQTARVGDVDVDADMLRRLATLTEAIGHTVHYNCTQGYGPYDRPLLRVELPQGGRRPKVILGPEGDERHMSLCPRCRVSVIMDLGVVDL